MTEKTNTWWAYVERIGGTNQSAIAKRMTDGGTPFTPASISRWRDSVPKPSSVRAFASAYGRPVLEAFVAAGFLDERDVDPDWSPEVVKLLDTVETSVLISELSRRVSDAEGGASSDAPASEAEQSDGQRGEPETAGDRLRRQGPKVAPRAGHGASSRGKRPHESS